MGKCGYCGKEVYDNNNLIAVYDSYYCSKKCAISSLLEKKESIIQNIASLKK